ASRNIGCARPSRAAPDYPAESGGLDELDERESTVILRRVPVQQLITNGPDWRGYLRFGPGRTLLMAKDLSSTKERKKLSKKSFALPGKRKYPIPTRRTPEMLLRGSRSTERPLSRRKSRQQSRSAIPAWARTARKARNDRRRGRSRMPRTLSGPCVAIRSGSAPESAPPLRT